MAQPPSQNLPALGFQHAACGLLTLDSDGLVVHANSSFCMRFGYELQALIGTDFIKLLTPGGRVFSQTHWFPLMQMQGSVSELKLDILDGKGARVPTLINALRHKHEDAIYDQVAVFIVADRQKYEQALRESRQEAQVALSASKTANAALLQAEERMKALNERLVEADRFKDAFLATLAHELRNPISAVGNVTSILERMAGDNPQLTKLSGILDRQIGQMTRLVEDLLDAARVGEGKIELRLMPVDVNVIISEVLQTSSPAVNEADHNLTFERCTAALEVSGDPLRLAQAIQNLLNNAIKYTPSGGNIVVRSLREEGQAVVQVVDSGIGIAPEQVDRIFEMFGQLSAGKPLAQGGLGIGLALIRAFVEMHNGSINVTSPGVGQGSAFTVRLPLAVK